MNGRGRGLRTFIFYVLLVVFALWLVNLAAEADANPAHAVEWTDSFNSGSRTINGKVLGWKAHDLERCTITIATTSGDGTPMSFDFVTTKRRFSQDYYINAHSPNSVTARRCR